MSTSMFRKTVVCLTGAVALTAALAACGTEDDAPAAAPSSAAPASPSPSSPSSPSSSPSVSPSASSGAAAGKTRLDGVWASEDGSLRLELKGDGTFSEDYSGQEAAYTGAYTLADGVLSLRADSGAAADGTVRGDTIEISGRTLKPAS
ncbi:Atu4866 domain-containing protein [Streptomyces filamentosus]|uniref:Atu4866 domain-containing protein n=1 Tax=Streptomyces filamentosus TaxID=67294 RepID=UPI003813BD01